MQPQQRLSFVAERIRRRHCHWDNHLKSKPSPILGADFSGISISIGNQSQFIIAYQFFVVVRFSVRYSEPYLNCCPSSQRGFLILAELCCSGGGDYDYLNDHLMYWIETDYYSLNSERMRNPLLIHRRCVLMYSPMSCGVFQLSDQTEVSW